MESILQELENITTKVVLVVAECSGVNAYTRQLRVFTIPKMSIDFVDSFAGPDDELVKRRMESSLPCAVVSGHKVCVVFTLKHMQP